MMKDYFDAFLGMVKDMTRNSAIQIDDFNCAEGCEPELIDRIEQDFSLKLPDSVRQFYQQCNGVSLKWSSELLGHRDKNISGSIWLLDLEKVFYGPDGLKWEGDIWMNWMSEELKLRRIEIKPFDYFDPDDSGCCCFDMAQPDISVDLMLHSVDYGLNSMSCNFTQYLDYLLKTRGLIRWQYLLSSAHNFMGYHEHEEFIHKTMRELFNETM